MNFQSGNEICTRSNLSKIFKRPLTQQHHMALSDEVIRITTSIIFFRPVLGPPHCQRSKANLLLFDLISRLMMFTSIQICYQKNISQIFLINTACQPSSNWEQNILFRHIGQIPKHVFCFFLQNKNIILCCNFNYIIGY